ncbi:MAG: hypothetical protein LBV40_03120 [Methanomicrobiales archaeon]|jgi:hypothetical protein|nr:hypothetical protein [Methanomicrobiales archaeon]
MIHKLLVMALALGLVALIPLSVDVNGADFAIFGGSGGGGQVENNDDNANGGLGSSLSNIGGDGGDSNFAGGGSGGGEAGVCDGIQCNTDTGGASGEGATSTAGGKGGGNKGGGGASSENEGGRDGADMGGGGGGRGSGTGGNGSRDGGGGGGGGSNDGVGGSAKVFNYELKHTDYTTMAVEGGNGGDSGLTNGGGGGAGAGVLVTGRGDTTVSGTGSSNFVDSGNVVIKAGDGGATGFDTPAGGAGGSATLDLSGFDLQVENTLKMFSGKDGKTDTPGRVGTGGDAEFMAKGLTADTVELIVHDGDLSFTVDTLTANTITLAKNNGDLSFDVGTLDLTGRSTTLTLENTDANDVSINTINLGGNQVLTVKVDSTVHGDFNFNTLNVLGAGATYNSELELGKCNVIFDLTNIDLSNPASSNVMLKVTGDVDLDDITFDMIGNIPVLQVGQTIILLQMTGTGSVFTYSGTSPNKILTSLTSPGYTFEIEIDKINGQVVLKGVVPPPIIPPGGMNNNDSYNYASTRSETVINPFIMSISATPILGGAYLVVEAWSGEGIIHSYQWQVQQPDGAWVNIPGATTASFEYTGLAPGKYTVRCIVSNSTGGETISSPVRVTVS